MSLDGINFYKLYKLLICLTMYKNGDTCMNKLYIFALHVYFALNQNIKYNLGRLSFV